MSRPKTPDAKIYSDKAFGEYMDKLKTIWLPKGKRVYVWQGLITTEQRAYEQLVAVTPASTPGRNNTSVNQSAVLIKEMDETNNWARLGAQLYFGWFTLMITINGVAIGWLFSARVGLPRFARLLFLIFVVLNLMGTISTYLIRNRMLDCDARIQVVLAGLSRLQGAGGSNFAPKSPVPRQAINTVFAFTGAALLMLLIFWIVLAIWPHVFLA